MKLSGRNDPSSTVKGASGRRSVTARLSLETARPDRRDRLVSREHLEKWECPVSLECEDTTELPSPALVAQVDVLSVQLVLQDHRAWMDHQGHQDLMVCLAVAFRLPALECQVLQGRPVTLEHQVPQEMLACLAYLEQMEKLEQDYLDRKDQPGQLVHPVNQDKTACLVVNHKLACRDRLDHPDVLAHLVQTEIMDLPALLASLVVTQHTVHVQQEA